MKMSLTADFLIFVAGLIIIAVIMSTAFGKGVTINFLNYYATLTPEFLAEDTSTFLTVISYVPGDVSAKMKIEYPRKVEITSQNNFYSVTITDISTTFRSGVARTRPFAYNPSFVDITTGTENVEAGYIFHILKKDGDITIESVVP